MKTVLGCLVLATAAGAVLIPQSRTSPEPAGPETFSLITGPRAGPGDTFQLIRFDSQSPEPANKPRSPKLLYFTRSDCVWCQKTEREVFPALKASGWLIGSKPDSHIRPVPRKQFPELTRKYKITRWPTYVRLENRRPVARAIGYLDPVGVSDLYRGRLGDSTPRRFSGASGGRTEK